VSVAHELAGLRPALTGSAHGAFRCFMGNELELLIIGNCVLHKSEQDTRLKQDYSSAFEL
jgi:hypothetical protein